MGPFDGAKLLEARGYRHTDSGLWYNQETRKVFTDEYVWRRSPAELLTDLAQPTALGLGIHSSWPLGPEVLRQISELMTLAE